MEVRSVVVDGHVRIAGSVRPGLVVEAGGDVEVSGDVEAGARIDAKGEIAVTGGIVGDRARVVARGCVRTVHVRQGEVMARGDVVVRNGNARARVRTGGRLAVGSGGISGGEARAVTGIEVSGPVGAPAGETAEVGIVADPEIAARLAKVRQGLNFCERDIGRILRTLGLKTVSKARIQTVFQRLPASKKRFAIEILKQLNQLVKLREELLEKQAVHQARSARIMEKAGIAIAGTALSGTRIRIGEQKLELDRDIETPVFHLTHGVISW